MNKNKATIRAMQAVIFDLAAKLSELADNLTACVQSNADSSDLLEALELTAEDLSDFAAKYSMKADELRYSGQVAEKSNKAVSILFRSPAIDRLINAARAFKKAEGSNIAEALCELGNNSLVVAYACNRAIEKAKAS